jgi:hypothetical protein
MHIHALFLIACTFYKCMHMHAWFSSACIWGVSGSVTCQVKLHSHSGSQGTSGCQQLSTGIVDAKQRRTRNDRHWRIPRDETLGFSRFLEDTRRTRDDDDKVAAMISPMPSTHSIRDWQECDKADEFIRSCVRTACEAIRLFYASIVQPVARNNTVWLNHGITLGPTP